MKIAQAQIIEKAKRLDTLGEFGRLIQGLRNLKKTSIHQIAKKTHIDEKTWSEIEKGKISHREILRLLPEIANGLGVEAFTLFESLITLRSLRP